MFSCKAFFPGALLAAAFSTQAEGLDLSYPPVSYTHLTLPTKRMV